MRCASVQILLVSFAWSHAKEYVDTSSDNLFHRAFREPLPQDEDVKVDLENTTLGKTAQMPRSLHAHVARPALVGSMPPRVDSFRKAPQPAARGFTTPRAEGQGTPDPRVLQQAQQFAENNKEMMAKMAELQNDPEFKDIFDEIKKGGPEAMQKYYNDPDFLQKLGAKMGDVKVVPAAPLPQIDPSLKEQMLTNPTEAFKNPQVQAMMKDPAFQAQMKAQTAMMQNPEYQAKLKGLSSDPELAPMFEEMKKAAESGQDPMGALMKYYNDPELLQKISKKLGGVPGMPAQPPPGRENRGPSQPLGNQKADMEDASNLFEAAGRNDAEAAQDFIATGESPNMIDELGRTPLHIAVAVGADLVTPLLIEAKADLEIPDKGGMTALHYATGYGRPTAAYLLLDKGANIEAKEKGLNQTPYEIATANEKNPVFQDPELMKRLLPPGMEPKK